MGPNGIFGGAEGSRIAAARARCGLTQRQLASKLGLTLREMKAIEQDRTPEPRLEKRTYSSVFSEFLGRRIHVCRNWPVEDKKFDIRDCRSRAFALLEELPVAVQKTRKNIAQERTRLERARRKTR